MKQQTNLQKLLGLLEDKQWHPSDELAYHVSLRFGHTIFEARKKGYPIETGKISHNRFQYRLLGL
jgi:hypothetical protein